MNSYPSRIGPVMKKVLEFAKQYPGWHTYAKDRSTVDAVKRLWSHNFVLLNPSSHQFKLKD